MTVIATGFDLKPNETEQEKAIRSLDINAIFSGKNLNPQPSTQVNNVQPAPASSSNNSSQQASNITNALPNSNSSVNNLGTSGLTNNTKNTSKSNEVNLLDIPEFLQKP